MWALIIWLLLAIPAFAQAPPVGGASPVQPQKTGSYTIKPTDLKSTIPFNCTSPCTVTMPRATASFPKGYPVTIQNIGSTTVTITATPPSTLYGVPVTNGNIILNQYGQYAEISADAANNYLASGVVASGGAPTNSLLIISGSKLLISTGSSFLIQ
jgi:hypothetical protein